MPATSRTLASWPSYGTKVGADPNSWQALVPPSPSMPTPTGAKRFGFDCEIQRGIIQTSLSCRQCFSRALSRRKGAPQPGATPAASCSCLLRCTSCFRRVHASVTDRCAPGAAAAGALREQPAPAATAASEELQHQPLPTCLLAAIRRARREGRRRESGSVEAGPCRRPADPLGLRAATPTCVQRRGIRQQSCKLQPLGRR
mmetsp:Transcript_103669/g.278549  ORF Transcript_103669/g.278549 Transcript_103669/m.278549 type:complete len:201 (+) Transcript_103669:27-629(+)